MSEIFRIQTAYLRIFVLNNVYMYYGCQLPKLHWFLSFHGKDTKIESKCSKEMISFCEQTLRQVVKFCEVVLKKFSVKIKALSENSNCILRVKIIFEISSDSQNTKYFLEIYYIFVRLNRFGRFFSTFNLGFSCLILEQKFTKVRPFYSQKEYQQ